MLYLIYTKIFWIWYLSWLFKDLYEWYSVQKVTPYRSDPLKLLVHVFVRGMMSLLWPVFVFNFLYFRVRGRYVFNQERKGIRHSPDPFDLLEKEGGKFSNAAQEKRKRTQEEAKRKQDL